MMVETWFNKNEVEPATMYNTLAATELESDNTNIVEFVEMTVWIRRWRQTQTFLITSTSMRWLKRECGTAENLKNVMIKHLYNQMVDHDAMVASEEISELYNPLSF